MKSRTIAVLFIALTVLLVFSFPTVTSAQTDRDALRASYHASATLPTAITGIRHYPEAPKGFDPLASSDQNLAQYGFPPRPNAQTNPQGYALWARNVHAFAHHPTPLSKDMGASSMPGKPAPAPASEAKAAAAAGSGVPLQEYFYNWSGVANTNKLKKWNNSTSFDLVISEFVVPPVHQAFGGVCDGGYDWEVSWNGVDGDGSGDVVQGGSSSQAYCSGGTTAQFYCGWVEWYPSYSIICEFGVNPGDVMFADTFASPGFDEQTVCISDQTQDFGDCYGLSYVSGPGVIGNSAEFVVERPCCRGANDYPLANYVATYTYPTYAYDEHDTLFYPDNQTTNTQLINMVDDNDDQVISYPVAGSAGTGIGKEGIAFFDENCAYYGGCTP